jgi:50S ribosomal protein L16 3-hydroxylase
MAATLASGAPGGQGVLDVLFPAIGADRFLEEYFPTELYVAHGPLERLGELVTRRVFDDVSSTIDVAGEDESIYYYLKRDGGVPDQRVCNKRDALAAYQSGHTVEFTFSQGDRVSEDWCRALGRELGEVANFAEIVLSPRGDAIPKHFDSVEVIIVQLRGSKTWQIAPNEHLRYPAVGHIPGFGTDLRDPYVGRIRIPDYAKYDFSMSMPPDHRVVDMVPGSVIFLPRGWWHQTFVPDFSVSLSVVLRTTTVAQLMERVIALRLHEMERWRRPISTARSSDLPRLRGELRAMAADLCAELDALDPAAVLDRSDRSFRVRDGVTIEVLASDNGTRPVRFMSSKVGTVEMALPDAIAAALEFMATSGTFTYSGVQGQASLDDAMLDNVLHLLIERGAIEELDR